jgi:hypothetical protein
MYQKKIILNKKKITDQEHELDVPSNEEVEEVDPDVDENVLDNHIDDDTIKTYFDDDDVDMANPFNVDFELDDSDVDLDED